MITRDDALGPIAEYDRCFRREDVGKLNVSGLYALSPSAEDVGLGVTANWRDNPWPCAERTGVYLIFDENRELLYIGKASLDSSLGGRLYNYFRAKKDHSCLIRHAGWSRQPRYVITVAVPLDMRFESPALEEYLITKLRPRDNIVGIRPCD